ncbi:MAG TPA: hypothetical protein VNN80_16990 [Polyangiaceae bacterium]|nr:hypothetical protein [Polyangiaceae bacterium]
MAPVDPAPDVPSAEELQRELESVRAAQPPDPTGREAATAQPSVKSLVLKRLWRVLGLWLLLVLAFLAIWQFLAP